MARLSRHTLVVLLIALLSCVGGMSIAVVAFGQSGGDPDAAVPTGDFTGTTPAPVVTTAQSTGSSTLGDYTTTVPTTTPTTPTTTTAPTTSQGHKAPHKTAPTVVQGHSSVPLSPARPTNVSGPQQLAFTGGEPIIVGGGGIALMLFGVGVAVRQRRVVRRQI
jgi:hypothetical protein